MKKYVIAFAVVSLLMALLYFAGIITAAMWGGCELICLAVLFLFSRVLSDGSAIIAATFFTAMSVLVWTQLPERYESFGSQIFATLVYAVILVVVIILFVGLIMEAVRWYKEIKNGLW